MRRLLMVGLFEGGLRSTKSRTERSWARLSREVRTPSCAKVIFRISFSSSRLSVIPVLIRAYRFEATFTKMMRRTHATHRKLEKQASSTDLSVRSPGVKREPRDASTMKDGAAAGFASS